jgi:hypothetical protein
MDKLTRYGELIKATSSWHFRLRSSAGTRSSPSDNV